MNTFDRISDQLFDELRPSMLLVLGLSVFVLTILAGWLYGFKKPLATYKSLSMQIETLKGAENTSDLQQRVETALARRDELRQALLGQQREVPANQLVAELIRELDRLASGVNVRLLRVTPAAASQVLSFREQPFEVEVSGDYFALHEWLARVEENVGAMVIRQLQLEPGASERARRMQLTMASYRPGTPH